ncbi:MAG: alternative ribosome rescue aminoacyl-tRNA hydrolase ArfB, partial [Gammaproteobacteria bacterium]
SRQISIPEQEIEISAIRAQGAGGQKVNKASSAIHLRFDSQASSLPDAYKMKLLEYRDRRITRGGIVIIKAQEFRSQEKNKAMALARLQQLIRQAALVTRKRIPTRPSRSSKLQRLAGKTRRGKLKRMRSRYDQYE